MLKLDYNGDIVWRKTYGLSTAIALSVQQTSDGGYVVAGWKNSSPAGIFVLRLDSNGGIIWTNIYGSDDPPTFIYNSSIIQTQDGGFIMTGGTKSLDEALLVMKINTTGAITWQKKYPTSVASHGERKYPIQQTSDGGYIIAGDSRNGDIWILKLDGNGNTSWQKTYGGEELDFALSIEETIDGGFIVAGGTYSFGAGADDFWVLKLDNSGNVSWQKTYGGESWDFASSIKNTSDGGYIVVGGSSSFGNYDNLWILKLDGTGNILWQRIYLERRSGFFPTLELTSDGGYVILSASSNPPTNDWKIWVLKLDSNGEIPDCEVLGTTNATFSDTTVSAEDGNAITSSTNLIAVVHDSIAQDTSLTISSICHYDDPLDTDGDGIANNLGASFASTSYNGSFLIEQDNCPTMPNGPFLGVCSKGTVGGTCIVNEACGVGGICSMNQEDSYPPQGNGIGDACDCEGNFDCDEDCDGTDASTFKVDFGRSTFDNPCEDGNPCNGDFDCDGDCDGTDAAGFKFDFGRSSFNNPCPACVVEEWCGYDEMPFVGSYSNSGCLGNFMEAAGEYGCGDDEIVAEVMGNVILLKHFNAFYNCCPDDIAITMTVEGNVLQLKETEINVGCRCMCCYTVESEIGGVEPGEYTIEYCWNYPGTSACNTLSVTVPQ